MNKIAYIAAFLATFACDLLKISPPETQTPLRIEQVTRCNKYRTCVVVFSDGTQGLMTAPKEGEYGCKSLGALSYNRCDPKE